MMFVAIDAPIPWKGLLLAYGAGQLAATLPITPGGLGVVEGTITVALVAFGGAETSTAYAVLLYRVISFWMILVIGWLLIGQLALQVRRGRWPARPWRARWRRDPWPTGRRSRHRRPGQRRRRRREPRAAPCAAGARVAGWWWPRCCCGLLGGPHRPRDDRRVVLPGAAHGRQGGGRARAPGGGPQVHARRACAAWRPGSTATSADDVPKGQTSARRLHGALLRVEVAKPSGARRARWRWRW